MGEIFNDFREIDYPIKLRCQELEYRNLGEFKLSSLS